MLLVRSYRLGAGAGPYVTLLQGMVRYRSERLVRLDLEYGGGCRG